MINRKVLLAGVAVLACAALGVALVIWKPWGGASGPERVKPIVTVPSPRKEPEMSPEAEALRLIADGKADYSLRVRTVEKLTTNIRPELLGDIIRLIKDPTVHETIRNDLLGRLEVQDKPVGGLGPLLINMWKDQQQSWLWRNYCLQHMAPVWKVEPVNRGALVDTLLGVLETEKGVMYETAMLSLEKIGASEPAVAEKVRKLAQARLEQARSSGWQGEDAETAVTALNLAANAGDRSVLPDARKLAADGKALARLRMAALATLGRLGDKGDVELLSRLASGPEGRVQKAAELNLATLKKRLGDSGGQPAPGTGGPSR